MTHELLLAKYIWRTDTANQRGGVSEWESKKILLEGDRGSNKMNTTSNTRLRLTTQVGQDHATTGVLLVLGTNNQLQRPENAAEHQLEPHWPTPVRSVSTTGQTGPYWWNLGTSTKRPLHRSGWCSSPVRPVQARKPQIYQTGLPSSKLIQPRNSSNTGQQRTHPNVHPSKTQQESALVRPVRGTGQTGVTWALGMNNTRGSTPPDPTPDLANRSIELRKTLGIVGTPHGHSIAKILSTKLAKSTGIKEIPPRTPLTLQHLKPQNRAPLLTDLGGESKGKEPRRVHAYIPTKSQRERPRNLYKKIAKKGLRKSPKRTNGNNTSKPWGTTPNHLYITKRFIQGLAYRPIILPSHKISPWSSQASPIENLGK
jgi:hypothetical protein